MKIGRYTFGVVNKISSLIILGMVFSVTIAVIGRYIFNSTPAWSESLALFLFTWFGLLGASLAEKDDSHIRVKIIENILPSGMLKSLNIFYLVIKFIFAGTLIIEGFRLTQTTATSILGGLRISTGWLNLSAPVAGIIIVIFLISNLISKGK